MKRSLAVGIVLLSAFLAFSFLVGFAENDLASKDKANATTLTNTTNMTNTTVNSTEVLTGNATATELKNATQETALSGNATHPFANATNPFANTRGKK